MRELKMIVCLRQVPDPNASPTDFVVDSGEKKVMTVGVPPVINPFDENALEAALRLKEKHGGTIIAIGIGEKLSKPIMIKALAVGADDLILLEDGDFNGVDTHSIADALFFAIKKIGEYDLILTGMLSSDWCFGQVGIVLAEILEIPCIAMAQKIEVENTSILAKKATRNGYQVIRASMPALITADSLVGELRYPSLKAIVLARKRPLIKWNREDLEIDTESQKVPKHAYEIIPPPQRQRFCRIIDGASGEEKGRNLALALYEGQKKGKIGAHDA